MIAYVPYDAWNPNEDRAVDDRETNELFHQVLERRREIAERLPAQVVREIRSLVKIKVPMAKIVTKYRAYGVTGPIVHMLATPNEPGRLRQDVN